LSEQAHPSAAPEQIVLIRHGEKPDNPPSPPSAPCTEPPCGVDINGLSNGDSLIPQGWQRAGALAVLFDPEVGPLRSPLTRPGRLYAPCYVPHGTTPPSTTPPSTTPPSTTPPSTTPPNADTISHRPYETIFPLGQRLGIAIECPYETTQHHQLAARLLADDGGTSLVCWEHDNLPDIARLIPLAPTSPPIPSGWPVDKKNHARFDVIWLFTLAGPEPRYTFAQLPQLLLASDTPI